MNYIQVKAIITPYSEDRADVLMALMGQIGFESFENTVDGLLAYIPEAAFTAEELTGLELPWDDTRLAFSHELIPDQNWNEEWEKHYFQPIVVENKCVVRSPFHAAQPEIPLEIIIAPKCRSEQDTTKPPLWSWPFCCRWKWKEKPCWIWAAAPAFWVSWRRNWVLPKLQESISIPGVPPTVPKIVNSMR